MIPPLAKRFSASPAASAAQQRMLRQQEACRSVKNVRNASKEIPSPPDKEQLE